MNTPNNTYWTTRDNRRLTIATMDLDHVQHCISMLTRQLGYSYIAYDYCPRIRLCELLTSANQEATMSALTDRNL
jgi:hypothetical protein